MITDLDALQESVEIRTWVVPLKTSKAEHLAKFDVL